MRARASLSRFGAYIINCQNNLKPGRFCIFLSFSRLIWPSEKWTKINVQKKLAQKSFEKEKLNFFEKCVCEHNAVNSVF